MTPNEWLDALVDDAPALRARFIGVTPPREQMYWRGPVLMHFDGEAWTRDIGAAMTSAPAIRPTGQRIRYEVEFEPSERRDLVMLDVARPSPCPPAAMRGRSRWRANGRRGIPTPAR
jgi:hypothetical protein